MASQIKLVYSAEPGLPQLLNRLLARFTAIQPFLGELALLGMAVASDATAINGTKVERTIVLDVLPEGEARFPTIEAKKFATRQLYGQYLAAHAPAAVHSFEPVVL